MTVVFTHYPRRSELTFPSDFVELQAVVEQLKKLKEEYFYHVLLLFSLAYLYKQTFAIPGSVFMVSFSGLCCCVALFDIFTEHSVWSTVWGQVGTASGLSADCYWSFYVLSFIVLLRKRAGVEILWPKDTTYPR